MMENNNEAPKSPEEVKKGENKVKLLLEEHLDELHADLQTKQTEAERNALILEIQKYQDKLAEHLKKLDAKYAVDRDVFSEAVRGTGEEAQAARMEARKKVSGEN